MRKISVAVTIDDQPASWAGSGGAAPSRTFTYATSAQPATGASRATAYQPTPTRHWIRRQKVSPQSLTAADDGCGGGGRQERTARQQRHRKHAQRIGNDR